MSGARPASETDLRSGPWSVELSELADGWEIKDSSCGETDGTTVSTAAGRGAILGVDPGDTVRCTFDLKLLAPKPGRWRAKNKTGHITCRGGPGGGGSNTLTIKAEKPDFGTIRVHDGGDRVVGKGLAGGGSRKITFRRDRANPRQYVGTVRMAIQGVRTKITYTFTLLDEEHAKGRLTASMRVQGVRCSVARPFELSYVGLRSGRVHRSTAPST